MPQALTEVYERLLPPSHTHVISTWASLLCADTQDLGIGFVSAATFSSQVCPLGLCSDVPASKPLLTLIPQCALLFIMTLDSTWHFIFSITGLCLCFCASNTTNSLDYSNGSQNIYWMNRTDIY